MFQVNDEVRCICPYNGPTSVTGVVVKGPTAVFGANYYTVAFLGYGNLLLAESCLKHSEGLFADTDTVVGELVTVNSKKVPEGTTGIVASAPYQMFGKTYYKVLLDNQEEPVSMLESSITFRSS